MMVRLRGFEPLTAWFVARYSIQLSYERAVCELHHVLKRELYHVFILLE